MIKFERPSYRVYIRSANCKFELYIDDVLVNIFKPESTEFGRGLNGETPLNSTILRNGNHKFMGKVLPWHNKNTVDNEAHLELTFYIIDSDNFPNKIELLGIETPWKKLETDISLPFFNLKGEFEVNMLPFELSGWTESINMKKATERKLFEEVFSFYQQLHALIAQRNATKYDELFREKEALISKAFYYDYHVHTKNDPMYTAMVNDRKNATKELFAEEGLQLLPLVASELKLLFQAEGKLVSLVRHDNSPALRFDDPKNGGEVEMEVRLHRKTKGSNLSII